VLETFPGATIAAVRERFAASGPDTEGDEISLDNPGDEGNTGEEGS